MHVQLVNELRRGKQEVSYPLKSTIDSDLYKCFWVLIGLLTAILKILDDIITFWKNF